MRLVQGRDLASLLVERGRFAPRQAVSIVTQVAAALDTAHAENLVHRDIKPGNILLTPSSTGDNSDDEFVYVTDFGISRAIHGGSAPLTATGTTVGSLPYLAPEQIDNES